MSLKPDYDALINERAREILAFGDDPELADDVARLKREIKQLKKEKAQDASQSN